MPFTRRARRWTLPTTPRGLTAIFENHSAGAPLPRHRHRDAAAARRSSGIETVGAWMMGVDTEPSCVQGERSWTWRSAALHRRPSDPRTHEDFDCDVLGLENGERPPLGFWLWLDRAAPQRCIYGHVHAARGNCGVRGTEKKYEDTERGSTHIAFARDRRRRHAQTPAVQRRQVPREHRARTGDTQFFLYDPDGVGVGLTFSEI